MNVEAIKVRFETNPFTQTAGNEQYLNQGEGHFDARRRSVKEFLENNEITEPSVMMDGRFDAAIVQETIKLYENLLDSLMSTPSELRTDNEEELINKIIDKTGELF